MKKLFLFLLLGFLQYSFAFSQEYFFFDFFPNTYFIPNSGIIEVDIKYKELKTDKESFRVRPIIKDIPTTVFSLDKMKWVFSSDTWGELPSVEEKIKIKIPAKIERIELGLIIKDLATGKEYRTPTKIFWTKNSYEKYDEKVNQTLKDWRNSPEKNYEIAEKKVDEISLKESERTGNNKNGGLPNIEQTQKLGNLKMNTGSITANISACLVAAIVGFSKKDDKMPL